MTIEQIKPEDVLLKLIALEDVIAIWRSGTGNYNFKELKRFTLKEIEQMLSKNTYIYAVIKTNECSKM
jgi:hypothetical protein